VIQEVQSFFQEPCNLRAVSRVLSKTLDTPAMKNLFPVFLLVLLAACQGGSINPEGSEGVTSACGVANPVQDLPWLKAALEKASEQTDYCTPWSVVQGTYQGQTVYIIALTGALCCTCGNAVYNCQGTPVMVCNAEEEAKIENKKVIWKKS
jgi:hypothetical protein